MTRGQVMILAWLIYIAVCIIVGGPVYGTLALALPSREPCEPWFK